MCILDMGSQELSEELLKNVLDGVVCLATLKKWLAHLKLSSSSLRLFKVLLDYFEI